MKENKLNYPPGVVCYGDFFHYIDVLMNHDNPVRLVINPPYTDRMIDATADKVVAYMNQKENAEFIAMLPDWQPQGGIEKLSSLKGSVVKHYAPNDYVLYDSIHEKSIKPFGVKLIIIVNLGHDREESERLSEEIQSLLREESKTIL